MFQYTFFGQRCWRTNDNKCSMSTTRYATRNVASRTIETDWTFWITARRLGRQFDCQCYFVYWSWTYLFARIRLPVHHSSSTLNPKILTIILLCLTFKPKKKHTLSYFKRKCQSGNVPCRTYLEKFLSCACCFCRFWSRKVRLATRPLPSTKRANCLLDIFAAYTSRINTKRILLQDSSR